MPRRVGKNVFDVDRQDAGDQPTVTTRPEPAPLEGLLRKVSDKSDDSPQHRAADASVAPKTPNNGAKLAPTNVPRGQGGRPAGADQETVGITVAPARVPTQLYSDALDLVKGRGKPSWGQLVSWTCQDAPEAVLEAVAALVAAAASPRQLRGQNREGGATTQVTARMTPEELSAFESVRAAAAARTERDVNRTVVVIGALDVATRQASSA